MIAAALDHTESLLDAVRTALEQVEGTYGLLVYDAQRPDEIVAARNGSPVILGVGNGETYIASDASALVQHTQQVVHLDDGQLVTVRATGYSTSTLRPVAHEVELETAANDYELGEHPDYMHKEMFDQPEAVRRALRGRLDHQFATARLGGLALDPRELRAISRVVFLGCGSAYCAGQAGAAVVEELAHPRRGRAASEFRYRNPVVDPDALYVAVSQSGETLDTLKAVQELQRKGGRVLGGVNVIGSAIARECGAGDRAARRAGDRGRVHQGADEHDRHVHKARAAA